MLGLRIAIGSGINLILRMLLQPLSQMQLSRIPRATSKRENLLIATVH